MADAKQWLFAGGRGGVNLIVNIVTALLLSCHPERSEGSRTHGYKEQEPSLRSE